jgi:alpha-beta hydrolase superfamily lysophospholipase
MAMIIEEYRWETLDHLPLYAQSWLPADQTKAAICLVHGLGDHSGRFSTHFARTLTGAGYAVLAFDLRGHGKSGGPRGHLPSILSYLSDIDLLLAHARERFPDLPVFLYGHSLGGILVLSYALHRQPSLAGVIATGPGLRTALEEQKIKIASSKLLGVLIPSLTIPTGLVPGDISRDPVIVNAYVQDPLVHRKATTSFARCMLEENKWILANAASFPQVPLLLMHGTGDRIAYSRGSQEFARLAGERCTLKLWEGLFHEIHNEPEKDQVFAYLINWLDQRFPHTASGQSSANMRKSGGIHSRGVSEL